MFFLNRSRSITTFLIQFATRLFINFFQALTSSVVLPEPECWLDSTQLRPLTSASEPANLLNQTISKKLSLAHTCTKHYLSPWKIPQLKYLLEFCFCLIVILQGLSAFFGGRNLKFLNRSRAFFMTIWLFPCRTWFA